LHCRIVLLALATIAVVGCTRWSETESLGAFQKTEYWQRNTLDWEGGNTFVRKTTLCSRITNLCINDTIVHVNAPPTNPLPRWIAVNGTPGGGHLYFLDTETGSELECSNCEGSLRDVLVPSATTLTWAPGGARAAALVQDDAGGLLQFLLLEVSANGITSRQIAAPGARNLLPRDFRFSPDGDVLAWHECAQTCALRWYRVEDEALGVQTTPCAYNTYLDIGWVGNQPRSQFYWSAAGADLCYDENGQLALPFGEKPAGL